MGSVLISSRFGRNLILVNISTLCIWLSLHYVRECIWLYIYSVHVLGQLSPLYVFMYGNLIGRLYIVLVLPLSRVQSFQQFVVFEFVQNHHLYLVTAYLRVWDLALYRNLVRAAFAFVAEY